jgi:Icc protein
MSGIASPSDRPSGIRLLQLTDLHILAEAGQTLLGVDTEQSFRDVLALALQEENPDCVLLTGDLVQDTCESSYGRLRAWLQATDWTFYCLPGNHDDTGLMATGLAGGRIRYESRILLNRWQIICLDSSVENSPKGHLAREQLSLLEQYLAEYPEHHALIALHHHTLPSGSAWMDTMVLDNADAFVAVLARFPKVKLVLSGHVHQLMDVQWGDIRFLSAPATCFQFKPQSGHFALDDIPPGYRWLALNDDGSFATGIRRLEYMPRGLEINSAGY